MGRFDVRAHEPYDAGGEGVNAQGLFEFIGVPGGGGGGGGVVDVISNELHARLVQEG